MKSVKLLDESGRTIAGPIVVDDLAEPIVFPAIGPGDDVILATHVCVAGEIFALDRPARIRYSEWPVTPRLLLKF